MNILGIGARPDDIVLGCGGLKIKCASQGHEVNMYVVIRAQLRAIPCGRTREFQESAKFTGADNLMIDNFEDTKLVVSDDLIDRIIKARTDFILIHSDKYTLHDHRAIALAIVDAGPYDSNILAYEILLTKNFSPQVYFDVSDVIDVKVRLIEIFWSQHSKLYLKANAIRGLQNIERCRDSILLLITLKLLKC